MDAATVASSSASTSHPPSPPSHSSSSEPDRPNKRQRLTPTPPPPVSLPPVHKNRLDYRGGLFLAPMVRIGCSPSPHPRREKIRELNRRTVTTRLVALEYGAGLVWGPEIIDKAMIGAVRSVDGERVALRRRRGHADHARRTDRHRPIYATGPETALDDPPHRVRPPSFSPEERAETGRRKSRLIYQIGSADKHLALQAAQTVAQDVSGIDLNCGCPKVRRPPTPSRGPKRAR